jgi:hypothetical protein
MTHDFEIGRFELITGRFDFKFGNCCEKQSDNSVFLTGKGE